MKKYNLIWIAISFAISAYAQNIPIDTSRWDITANAYIIEQFKGQESIYIKGGLMTLKEASFLNGTIEFDIYLKEEQAFPGVYFRRNQSVGNAEQFYLRPHLSGKPDANQAIGLIQNISPWQLCFGPRY